MTEEFKPIPGFDSYGVSRAGVVKNLSTDRTLKPSVSSKGYLRIALWKNGHARGRRQIGAFVLLAWVGPKPPGHHAAHLNGNPKDNRLENLAWVTPKENARHRDLHGTTARGARIHGVKLTQKQVEVIREIYRPQPAGSREGNVASIAEAFGVSERTVQEIAKGKSWMHVAENSDAVKVLEEARGALIVLIDLIEQDCFESWSRVTNAQAGAKVTLTALNKLLGREPLGHESPPDTASAVQTPEQTADAVRHDLARRLSEKEGAK